MQLRKNRPSFWKKYGVGLLFASPFLIFFFVFTIYPIGNALYLSFTNYDLLQDAELIGFSNYTELFMYDDVFITALSNTLLYAVIAGPITYLMSFFMAWVINQLKFRNVFALAFYAPSITSSVAMSVVWLYFFSPDRFGFINNILFNAGIIQTPVLWTTDHRYIMLVVVIISIWMGMGNGFLVFMAGLQNVSSELYDAASIDGVRNKGQELWYVTLPQMKPQLLFGAINSIVSALAVFDVPVAVAGLPSPNYAAHTLVAHLYDYAFTRYQMGYACAVAVILFLLTFLLGRIFFWLLSEKD